MADVYPVIRYATEVFDIVGGEVDFDISFAGGYINQSHVRAYSRTLDEETLLATDFLSHTLTFISESPSESTVTVDPAPIPSAVAGKKRQLVIFRDTPKSAPLVNFTDGSVLTKANLQLSDRQSVYGIAEIMDGLADASITLERQSSEVINQTEIINEIYQQVLELLAAGGIVSVTPRVWFGVGDGLQTDFAIAGADVENAGFYDTYVSGNGLQPLADYTIVLGETPAESDIRFEEAPADGAVWFTVLRGYARPYTGPPPIQSLRMPVLTAAGTTYFVDKASEFALIRTTNSSPVTVTINEIPLGGDATTKLGTGSYFSVAQRGSGQVTIDADPEVILVLPADRVAKTRVAGSVISASCEYGDGNTWILSGDLAEAP